PYETPGDQSCNDAPCGFGRIIAMSCDHQLRKLGRLVRNLQSRHVACLSCVCLAINSFRVALNAYFERTIDEHFDEPWDLLPCPVAITPAVCRGIEDDRDSVIGQHPANESHRRIEILSILFVVTRLGGEQLAQFIGFEDGHLDSEIADLFREFNCHRRFSRSRQTRDPYAKGLLIIALHNNDSPRWD